MPGAARSVSEFPRRQFCSACSAAPTPLEAQVAGSEDPERRAVVRHLSLILKVPATWFGDLCAPENLLKKPQSVGCSSALGWNRSVNQAPRTLLGTGALRSPRAGYSLAASSGSEWVISCPPDHTGPQILAWQCLLPALPDLLKWHLHSAGVWPLGHPKSKRPRPS